MRLARERGCYDAAGTRYERPVETRVNGERTVAVTLRLARHGQKKRPFYRIIATEKENRRDGRFLEVVGTYNPMQNPPVVTLKEDRVRKWVDVGAQSTLIVENLIKKQIPGLIEGRTAHQLEKIRTARRKRKERARARQA
jgi:small subunit ribosomal protein S16